MKRFVIVFTLMLCIVQYSVQAQETVLKEISEMKNVEVIYISKAMLKSMRAHGMNVGGMNVSVLASELSSLNIITVEEGKSLSKVRNKLRTIGQDYNMETVMIVKDDDGSTEMYATRDSKNYYAQLLTIIDEGDEITIIYMTGTISMNSLNELTKRSNARINKKKKSNSYSYYGDWDESLNQLKEFGILDNIDISSFCKLDSLKMPSNENLSKLNDSIEFMLDKINWKLEFYRDSIDKIAVKIAKAGNDYEKRSKYYEEKNRLYNSRNKLYESRNALRNYIFRLKKAENNGKVGKTKVYVGGNSYVWVPNGDEDKPKWYLVVASCETMKEAEGYIKDKKLKDAEILKGRNGMYRISVANGSFREIKFLKNNRKYKKTEAWVCYEGLNV